MLRGSSRQNRPTITSRVGRGGGVQFGNDKPPGCPSDRAGLYYVSNSGTAPVLEISRPPAGSLYGGRIYWANQFSAPHGLDYEAKSFSRHVDRIWRWIRRNGHRRPGDGSMIEP